MNTFPDEVKQSIYIAQNGICAGENCFHTIHSYHHKLHNTKSNRKNFPLFIHSPINCIGLCIKCHTNFSHLFRINDSLAQIYEGYLQQLKTENYEE